MVATHALSGRSDDTVSVTETHSQRAGEVTKGLRIMATDGQERAVLAAIRCLGDAGFTVTGAASSRPAPGLSSRRCTADLVVPDAAQDPRAFVEAIGAHLQVERHDAIMRRYCCFRG